MSSELINRWEPTGLLDDNKLSRDLGWVRPVLSEDEKLELSQYLNECLDILLSRDEVPSSMGGDRHINDCPSILFLPTVTRLYRARGVEIDTTHIFFEMNKKWNNMRGDLKELAAIPTIDFEAEFIAIFCEMYDPKTPLDPNKTITKLEFI